MYGNGVTIGTIPISTGDLKHAMSTPSTEPLREREVSEEEAGWGRPSCAVVPIAKGVLRQHVAGALDFGVLIRWKLLFDNILLYLSCVLYSK